MKFVILIGDGMSDYPIKELGDKTPLHAARTPNMDMLAQKGSIGLVQNVPDGYSPGSDVAIMSVLGYNPAQYYTGRSPLEAASIGVKLAADDLAVRCNLVTLGQQDGKVFMDDFSADHITTDEAREIIIDVDKELGDKIIRFYPGVSYRHLMVWSGGPNGLETTPPHDISGKEIKDYLPKGKGAQKFIQLMNASQMLLKEHPVNVKREEEGHKPANSIWLWGQGRMPKLPTMKEKFGIEGSIISAVDLLKGLGIYAGLRVVNVPGATGYVDTNYRGKAEYALKELETRDFVCVHVEAPDEAGHNGDLKNKIKAIEDFDKEVVGRVLDGLSQFKQYRILVLPDHPTPIAKKTHTRDPVPFALYPSNDSHGKAYTEADAKASGLFIEKGYKLIERLFER
ncbi:MAG: cofactor-independent phosphoglycerate mutase [Deltaproteobacteria bacterium RIFCSPLOWO2_12_FULL_43_16]|nr:MAG: cofactor-independent phosphoglycerate mutase [Deltaproteobacteria bacterium GWA2_43_19]OGQ10029.1 MAG: cofactor-independent phosphoglycerate mutase [Deltaproteobacteria bacterium RIFCSPHIGHO2_02_FULL_43_33]OGQ58717.1 MAG: cofactor-independent phosphoglycerate mutase [Deltaproteobacteria bacterium RIFCSPLOWO2_12_FULL_43_16]HBR16521.1 cofactor-independent phosphoglycerate mutase [Deltaproteobacteria bacterium]